MTKYIAYAAVTAWLAWSAVSPIIGALIARSI